ncbi:hypothetical protein BJ138DRAFT_1129177 [Hygrophoropsis aurantiaca]|uniref:Uncharacterized protein n=1 Tax=Hygrophoropsis aurantiaca TaxID=72124 RepID=A0ACB8A2L4_9AGAM|nr:hypothetical protein BJ138DRAFT_1129177 [Hygrophoropsis aurantiaca]
MSKLMDMGIENATKAVEADNNGRYDEALRYYTNALEAFMAAIKWETNGSVKALLRKKTGEFLTRAETIKAYLEGQKKSE